MHIAKFVFDFYNHKLNTFQFKSLIRQDKEFENVTLCFAKLFYII